MQFFQFAHSGIGGGRGETSQYRNRKGNEMAITWKLALPDRAQVFSEAVAQSI